MQCGQRIWVGKKFVDVGFKEGVSSQEKCRAKESLRPIPKK